MSRKRRSSRNIPSEPELIAIYTIKNEFLRDALRYMFFANGGAITGVLIKFDIQAYRIPIFTFAFGILYTILIALLIYFYKRLMLVWSIKNENCPFNFYINNKWYYNILNFVVLILIYAPAIFFIAGIMFATQILFHLV